MYFENFMEEFAIEDALTPYYCISEVVILSATSSTEFKYIGEGLVLRDMRLRLRSFMCRATYDLRPATCDLRPATKTMFVSVSRDVRSATYDQWRDQNFLNF